MKRKINIQFILLTVLAIAATVLILTGVFYEAFQKEVMGNLQTSARVLEGTSVFDDVDHISYDSNNRNLRITLISRDGTVVYDNEANVIDMDNHGNRPEVEAAFAKGEGKAIRQSATLNKNSFYYAVLLKNGCVLRVAKEAGSIWSLYRNIIPLVLVITITLMAVAMLLTHFLTKSIVAPVEQLARNMDQLGKQKTYRELQPFIDIIVKQHEDLKKNASMRQEFTANVSHELKTPLTSISGYSELIGNGMANEQDTQRFAGEIHRNANRLLTLINDTLRLSEMDVAQEAPEMADINLYQIAQNVIGTLQISAQRHEIQLMLHGQDSMVHANRMMMEELIYNLTDNAIRYNNKNGSVDVTVSPQDGHTVLEVRDTGIGIPKEHQERVFERFYRVDKSRSKRTGGTGLGLAIVKHIANQHQAEIQLESEAGKGTRIRVIFPSAEEKE
ncbi:MAG: ATP-binding protein [Butyrivibrio sp.]|jgi:two-component system phosphate regulon sensor histidine kinase PhoR|nr:ATP-binding protein [Butyrivibrio sp.]